MKNDTCSSVSELCLSCPLSSATSTTVSSPYFATIGTRPGRAFERTTRVASALNTNHLQAVCRLTTLFRLLIAGLAAIIWYRSSTLGQFLSGGGAIRSTWKATHRQANMATSTSSSSYLNENGKESPWKYPRPPDLQKTSRHLRVVYGEGADEVVLADTTKAYRVLETRFVGVWSLKSNLGG